MARKSKEKLQEEFEEQFEESVDAVETFLEKTSEETPKETPKKTSKKVSKKDLEKEEIIPIKLSLTSVRGLVEDFYDVQDTRIESENRIRAAKQGVSEQEELFVKEVISKRLLGIENDIKKYIANTLEDDPRYLWLTNIKGVGPILAGGIIAWMGDVEKFATISKYWVYAGMAVDDVEGSPTKGLARKRKKGEKINWNPRVKTMGWKLGESWVKTKGFGRELYEKYRAEYDLKWTSPEICRSAGCAKVKKCMDAHRYMAAKRKVVKVFLACVHMEFSRQKGIPVVHPFIIGRTDPKGVKHEHLIKPEMWW